MLISVIADTHQGIRSDHPRVIENSKRFYDEVYFPTLRKRGIEQAVHLGDLFDRRKYVNIMTAHRTRKDFVGPHEEMGVTLHVILGNHDVYGRHDNSVSSVEELYCRHESVLIYKNPEKVRFQDLDVLFVPWINESNDLETLQAIKDTDATVCFGHLELQGFEMYRGVESHEGLNPDLFGKFDVVASGHFHHKSRRGHIHFLGSHSEFNWSDYDDDRGFHVFDTETKEFEFIPNPFTLHEKIHWNADSIGLSKKQIEDETKRCRGKYVKVIVSDTSRPDLFEKLIESIDKNDPISVQVVNDHLNADKIIENLDEVEGIEDTLSIFRSIAKEAPVDQERLDSLMTELFNEAQTIND